MYMRRHQNGAKYVARQDEPIANEVDGDILHFASVDLRAQHDNEGDGRT
jgi:hypothetical protein